MARHDIHETIDVPQGITVTVEGTMVTCKGPQGENKREILMPGILITTQGNELNLEAKQATQRDKKLLYTNRAHIKNMILGVQEGYLYKLKVCAGHFPMSVSIKGKTFEVKNFIGEKVPRTLTLKEGAEVKISGDIIEVRSNNKELAGQVAADIEKLTRRTGFDKRIFQDGIYITEKAGKAM